MKRRDFEYSRTKKQLQQYKQNGKKELVWKLSYKQIEVIKMMKGVRYEPYLYKIKTRPFSNIRSIKSSFLKDIHYKNKRGKKYFVTTLNNDEKQLLQDYNIPYHVVKYKIYLNWTIKIVVTRVRFFLTRFFVLKKTNSEYI